MRRLGGRKERSGVIPSHGLNPIAVQESARNSARHMMTKNAVAVSIFAMVAGLLAATIFFHGLTPHPARGQGAEATRDRPGAVLPPDDLPLRADAAAEITSPDAEGLARAVRT